jgi:purine catabolism regulator
MYGLTWLTEHHVKRSPLLPTVAEVLTLDPVRRGAPRVLAGADRLDAPVRWVHVIELADAAHLLRGGELVLSTGIALPGDPAGLLRYVADLAAVGVSALAVELGSRYTGRLPGPLVSAAKAHRLPLIELRRETPFIEITESVHGLIIDSQLDELRASNRLHQVFTELAVAGARADEVVRQASALAGCPVILETLAHQVLACEPGAQDARHLLGGFAARSRAARPGPLAMRAPSPASRTGYDPALGWLITTVGARGEDWGRLIMVRGGQPAAADVVLIERAATTLALGRLLDDRRESLERQAHRSVLSAFFRQDLVTSPMPTGPSGPAVMGRPAGRPGFADSEQVAARARALGLPVAGRQLVALVIRLAAAGTGLSAHARALQVADAAAAACRAERIPALVSSLDDIRVGALLALAPQADCDALLARVAGHLAQRLSGGDVIGAGSAVASAGEVQRSFLEAEQVADVAARHPDGQPYYRLPDLHLRGLLHLLRDDPRVQAFAERELGPLLRRDDEAGTQLAATLAAFLAAGGSKAAAARAAGLARPTVYQRLCQIEQVLGCDLGSAETRASLHVALLALEAI